LDDATAIAASWCDAARRLASDCKDSGAGEATKGDTRPRTEGQAGTSERLAAVAAGMKVRRRLDALEPDDATEKARRTVVARLADLQRAAIVDLADLRPGTALHREIAAQVRQWLGEARIAAQNVLTVLEFEPLHQAMAIEALRADLEWISAVVARLDGEPPPAPSLWLDAEIDRLRGVLGRPDGRHPDELDDPLGARCQAMQAALLGRRVRCALSRPMDVADPETLWIQRYRLSRLQAHVAALDRSSDGVRSMTANPRDDGAARAEWLRALEDRRNQLADQADERMAPLAPRDRREPCSGAITAALDEIGEMTALLEQMPALRAVRRLELARADLERLGESCRTWAAGAAERLVPAAGLVDGDDRARDERDGDRDAVDALRQQARRVDRLASRVRSEWREKLLATRMEALLGRGGAAFLEHAVLVLIPVLIGLIATEWILERSRPLSASQHRFFAWADLAICSVFLVEVVLRIALAPERGSYVLRHLLIDLIPSLPFGFVAHQMDLAEMGMPAAATAGTGALEWLAHMGRLAQVLRTSRLILPLLRLSRIALILLRLSDRLVRRMGKVLNRNIILFEPSSAHRPESRDRHRLLALRTELEEARRGLEERLDPESRRRLAVRLLGDFDEQLAHLPAPSAAAPDAEPDDEEHEIPVEAVVERLIQMTPERLVDRMGPSFVQAVDRYLRLLDVPLIRRLPLIRNVVVYREKSPAEAVALAANYLGHLIQRGLDVAYFLADLHGTLSPPVFLDRLGATIVNATRVPAKRLLILGSAFLLLFLIVNTVGFLSPFRALVDKLYVLLGWPVIILGAICLAFWSLGAWFRRIANQSAEFCERVVEAQFAAHTKNLKSRRRDQDAQFLSERVIDPEILLRSSDDQVVIPEEPGKDEEAGSASRPRFLFENRELAFLRNVRLLYQDYLDGSPLHRSDTKASIQLLGNLALANLRRSHLRHLLRESRMLDRLDLSRAGGLLGGPYLWFNYITRLLVQETALLILDYNRHAVPVDRLACSPEPVREGFRQWLAARLRVDPAEIWLPERPDESLIGWAMPREAGSDGASPSRGDRSREGGPPGEPGPRAGSDGASPSRQVLRSASRRRPEADAFLETVEFTAVDFLADDADRDAEIRSRFGPQVAELVRRDRQQNVRRAFRSYPLHELPESTRTINPFSLYETYIAGGRVVLLPFTIAAKLARLLGLAVRSVYRVVQEILHPRIDQDESVPSDTYWAALRKIHRMRKPVFMGSLWLRARFDVEYLGLSLPTAPAVIAAESMMEVDLDYIGATRQDRIIAEQVRHEHQVRLEWVGRWLKRFGWSFDELPGYLAREIPYLANRGGEALRALVAACVLDHDDIASLALSIEGLDKVLAYAAEPANDARIEPPGLPEPIVNLRSLWHPVHRIRRPAAGIFDLPCFPHYAAAQRRRIMDYLHRHRRAVRGWVRIVLGQGGPDPWETVRARMREVLLRTDLWSDQILVLRAVQSLTMLDVQHNCELVWNLGGYTTAAEPASTESDEPPSDADARPEAQGVPSIPLAEA
jgi:hypothetical protein